MNNIRNRLTKVTMNNYRDAFKHSDKLIQYGNHIYLNNGVNNEIANLIPRPIPRYKDYKQFNIKL